MFDALSKYFASRREREHRALSRVSRPSLRYTDVITLMERASRACTYEEGALQMIEMRCRHRVHV